ncbi:MAG: hypothetical protein AAGA54_23335 [Myxococcota bacterium]
MTAVPGFPADAADLDVEAQRASLSVDAQLYPRDAVYAACTPLTVRAFVRLDRDASGRTVVEIRPKDTLDAAGLRGLVGEVANELLTAATRVGIAGRRRTLLDAVTRRAVAGAMGAPGLDDLEAFDLDGEGFEDPLGIADSWDRSHGAAKEAGK